MVKAVVDWDTVSEIALSFPEVEEAGQERTSFKVRGKAFAWAARERDGGGLGIRVERDEKQLILDSNPDVYFTSPHYNGWPGVQIRLEAIDRDELQERLEDAWLIQAPKRLAAAYVAENALGGVRDERRDRGRERVPARLPRVEHVAAAEVLDREAVRHLRVEPHEVPQAVARVVRRHEVVLPCVMNAFMCGLSAMP